MTNQDRVGSIELVKCISTSNAQGEIPNTKPRLEINSEATKIITERFESPISVLVYMGSIGVGKSKLASLTVAHLYTEQFDESVLPFKSSAEGPYGVTRGVWMWNRPLKHRDPTRKGSILLLDCEGMNGIDPELGGNLYLFCMIISSSLAVVLQRSRIEIQQWTHLERALQRFQAMQTPSVLPATWLVPSELPSFQCGGSNGTAEEWIDRVFNLQAANVSASKKLLEELQKRQNFIRNMLPEIHAVNLTHLPHELKGDGLSLHAMFDILTSDTSHKYRESLEKALDELLAIAGKKLPGSTSNSLFIRPAELAQLMQDLIDVINGDVEPNPDRLIGQYLIKHFNDEIVGVIRAKFEKQLMSFAREYAREQLKQKPMRFEDDQTAAALSQERAGLIRDSIAEMRQSAEREIYGLHSVLLSSSIFIEDLERIRKEMALYTKPNILLAHIKTLCSSANTDATGSQSFEIEIDDEIRKLTGRIAREASITESIKREEVRCELEECAECYRPGGIVNLIHECTNGKIGHLYHYINDSRQIVCSRCRDIIYKEGFEVHCGKCGKVREIIRIID